MNVRFFYAPPIFSSIPKVYVLTEDLTLYSEIRDYGVVQVEKITVPSFSNFITSEYENEDYPILLEIKRTEALEMPLNLQAKWLERYLALKGIFNTEQAKQA
jgi:hypothetical protein